MSTVIYIHKSNRTTTRIMREGTICRVIRNNFPYKAAQHSFLKRPEITKISTSNAHRYFE